MANLLPDDVLFSNIFIWLPAKQLARMRCLSKPWNALLSQPYFVHSHLHHSIRNNDEFLMVFNDGDSFNRKPCSIHPSKSPDIEINNFIELSLNFPYEDAPCSIIGSVNGLICFSCGSSCDPIIHIWNPSLSVIMTLPPFTGHRSYIDHMDEYYFGRIDDCYFRFGFDPKTDDYKVVKLIQCSLYREWLPVEVYGMKNGSWNSIRESFPPHVEKIFHQNEVCIDGHDGRVHWLGCYSFRERKVQIIVTFDLGSETFSQISLPDSIQDYDGENQSVVFSFMAGKLCVMSREREVWVMDEYGVAGSWVKQHVFSKCSDLAVPVGFTLNNEFIYGTLSRLGLYDPNTTNVRYFESDPSLSSHTKIVQYVDSLVWKAPT